MRRLILIKLCCCLLMLTIGVIKAHTFKREFIRGLTTAGVGVTAAPMAVFGPDAALQANALVFVFTCADMSMSISRPHPATIGLAVGTGAVLSAAFFAHKWEMAEKRKKW